MMKYYVYTNGIYWGVADASSEEEAIQEIANKHGTIDVGEADASTEGMEASLTKLYEHEEE